MAIPITYNLRNLAERRVTTIMTALGAAVAVGVLISVLALLDGLRTSFAASGEANDLLVMRKGSTSELISIVTRQNFQDIRDRPGIEVGSDGQPLASLEFVDVINVADQERGRDMNFNLRAMMPVGFLLRPSFRIIQGRRFEPGRREVIVGRSIADRFATARPGGVLTFGHGDWEIVGVFEVGRTVFNGEIWGDLNQVSSDYNRPQNLSSLLLRAQPQHAVALARSLEQDRRFTLKVIPERQYLLRSNQFGRSCAVYGDAGCHNDGGRKRVCGDEYDVCRGRAAIFGDRYTAGAWLYAKGCTFVFCSGISSVSPIGRRCGVPAFPAA